MLRTGPAENGGKLQEVVNTVDIVRFMPLQRSPIKSHRYDLHDHGLEAFGSLQSPSRDNKGPYHVEEGYLEM